MKILRFFLAIVFFVTLSHSSSAENDAKTNELLKTQIDLLNEMAKANKPIPTNDEEKEFAGINFGIGLGASYLDHRNIREATVIGSQTRILDQNRRSADFILETHYLIDVFRSKYRKLPIIINAQMEALKSILESNATDTNQIQELADNLAKNIAQNRGLTSIQEDKLSNLVGAICKVKDPRVIEVLGGLQKEFPKLRTAPPRIQTKFGFGPFCFMKMGGDNIIDGFGLGLMFGFKSELTGGRIFNLGVARGFQNNVQRISESFDPAVESDLTKMFKKQDIDTLTVVISTNLW